VTLNRRQWLSFAVIAAMWSVTWIVIVDQLKFAPGPWSVAWRFLLAGAAMLALAAAAGAPMRLGARGHRLALLVGALQFCLNFNLVYAAEGLVTSGLVAVMFALLVPVNALLAWIMIGQRADRRLLAGAALGIAGVALLFQPEFARVGERAALGLGLSALAVLSAGIANISQAGQVGRGLPMRAFLGIAMLYGGAMDVGLAWALAGPPVLPLDARYLAGLVFLALGASALAFALYFPLIREIGAARAAYVNVVTPFAAMGLSTLFEGFRWTWPAVLGGVAVGAGLWLALGPRRV
jgi:drug/metabolite transporter (DMT)-like permease